MRWAVPLGFPAPLFESFALALKANSANDISNGGIYSWAVFAYSFKLIVPDFVSKHKNIRLHTAPSAAAADEKLPGFAGEILRQPEMLEPSH